MQFVLNLASSIVSAFGAGCGVALSDRMPRRQALIWGTLASAVFLAINGGLSLQWAHMPEDNKTLAVGQGCVLGVFKPCAFMLTVIFVALWLPISSLIL
jgi:hypothetical protein